MLAVVMFMTGLARAETLEVGAYPTSPPWEYKNDLNRGLLAYNNGDYETAMREWRPLAEQGSAVAQNNLGVMYRDGKGVEQDYARAARWYQLAAKQGVAKAQYNLGVMYANGQGVAQDYAEAARWYQLAANQGVAKAQHNLGVMYANGNGVAQDDAEAVKWYRLAAQQDIAKAQFNLALMYHNGTGVTQDDRQAHMWANISRVNGHADAGKLKVALEVGMTSSDIFVAQNLAQECLVSDYKNC
jgi:TPR repeat protein